MRIEDMPRPWLLAAVTGVPMAALLERAEQENAEQPEATSPGTLRDEQERSGPDRDPARYGNNVVMLPPWQ